MKCFLFLVFCCIPFSFFAKNVDVITAEKIAKFVLTGTDAQTRTNEIDVSLIWTGEDMCTRTNDSPAYYVFNKVGGNGFVIVSGDDIIKPILAYSYVNSFHVENMPDNLRAWMAYYREQINWAREENIVSDEETIWAWERLRDEIDSAKNSEEVLIETALWDQTAPYNLLCPTINGTQAPTGCVATALAIVMKYNRWPDQGSGMTFQYTTKQYKQTLSATYNIVYDWDNMLNKYEKGNYSTEEATLKELSGVVPDFRMTWLEERSQGAKNIYRVEMYSLGNVRIEGYYAVPKQKGKFPSVISFLGYGSGGGFPNPDNMPGFCEFILSTRGQGIQLPVNTYGKWIVHGLEDKLQYYYRGAFMDLVRGLDFLCSRPEVDMEKIFAEGGSQGGAFTLAACALDKRICAAAPYIPFLSDFRDYFKIAPWPRNVFEEYMCGHAESNWEEIYRLLSYFDIKNLAPRITCPIIMGVGLQDNICPPHINFSGYNQVKSPKHYYIYYDKEHTVGKSWWAIKDNFFRSFCN